MGHPDRVVFRLPLSALVLPVLAFLCITPLATAGGGWIVLYLFPVLTLVAVLLTRTVADRSGLAVTGPQGIRRLPWPDLDTLEFSGTRWGVAVAQDGRRIRLPMVRPRDLPRLVTASGGTLDLPVARPQPDQVDPPDELAEPDRVDQPDELAEPDQVEQPDQVDQPDEPAEPGPVTGADPATDLPTDLPTHPSADPSAEAVVADYRPDGDTLSSTATASDVPPEPPAAG